MEGKYQSSIFKQVLNQQSEYQASNSSSVQIPIYSSPPNAQLAPPNDSSSKIGNSNSSSFSSLFKDIKSNITNAGNTSSFSNIFKEITGGSSNGQGNSNSQSNANGSQGNNVFSYPNNNSTHSNANGADLSAAESLFSRNLYKQQQTVSQPLPPLPQQQQQQQQQQSIQIPIHNVNSNTSNNLYSRIENDSYEPNKNSYNGPYTPPLSSSYSSIPNITTNAYIYDDPIGSELPTPTTNVNSNTTNITVENGTTTNNSTQKTHKRFFSTSSLTSSFSKLSLPSSNTTDNSPQDSSPSSPKTPLFKSKIFDNTFKKVITSVKSVEGLLSQIGSNTSSNSSTPQCTTPDSSLLPASHLKPDTQSIASSRDSNNPFNTSSDEESSIDSASLSSSVEVNQQASQQATNLTKSNSKTFDFYSYYGNEEDSKDDKNNSTSRGDDTSTNNKPEEEGDIVEIEQPFETFSPTSRKISVPIYNNSPNDSNDLIVFNNNDEEFNQSLLKNSTNLMNNSSNSIFSKISSSTSSTSRANRVPILNLPYKSKLFEQVSSQQKGFERSLFSIPITQSNKYPNLFDDEEYQDFDEDFNNSGGEESSSSVDKIYSSNTENKFNGPKKMAIKQDINIQRFKPLPPLPNQTSKYDIQTQRYKALPPLPNQNSMEGTSYTKLNSILQLLSFSLSNPTQSTSGQSNDNLYHSLSTSFNSIDKKQKEDLTQYLNEYGDKIKIFQHINWHLDQSYTNIEIIKLLGTHYGFPENSRATSWKLINDYIPLNIKNRSSILLQKRSQYKELIKKYIKEESNNSKKLFINVKVLLNKNSSLQEQESKVEELIQQVHLDVIRTRPDGFVALFELKEIEKMMERVLVIWSLENSDVSYFQGLNDLLVPFLLVFLDHELLHCFSEQSDIPSYPIIEMVDPEFKVEKRLGDGRVVQDLIECGKLEALDRVEADMYWCINNLLSSVKHYAHNTGSGLPAETLMKKFEKLIKVSNEELYQHFQQQGLDFSHFSFRWMICFLTREFDIQTGIELWDRYLCDKNNEGFSLLHICFCAALLDLWTDELLTKDFMELVQFLQKPPSLEYKSSHLDLIFRNAIHLKETFRNFLIQ